MHCCLHTDAGTMDSANTETENFTKSWHFDLEWQQEKRTIWMSTVKKSKSKWLICRRYERKNQIPRFIFCYLLMLKYSWKQYGIDYFFDNVRW